VPGHPALPTRLMAGLQILKYTEDLSDEVLCARWVENPYYQYFCGEEFFQHELPFERTSMTRWRQRVGEEKLEALLQESLFVAVRLGAAKPADFTQVIVDTTLQEKNAAFPTEAKLAHRAHERLVRLAEKHDVELRQSYKRVGKLALIMQQRYAHAKHFNRAKAKLRSLRTFLGRTIRDITRKISGDSFLHNQFAAELYKANRVLTQKPRDGGKHIYSLHAPEVECIGKGKSDKPYEFGVKASIATTLQRSKGASSPSTPTRCPEGHMTATRSKQCCPKLKRSPAPASNAS
jgi:transposase, IS5 family